MPVKNTLKDMRALLTVFIGLLLGCANTPQTKSENIYKSSITEIDPNIRPIAIIKEVSEDTYSAKPCQPREQPSVQTLKILDSLLLLLSKDIQSQHHLILYRGCNQ